MQRLRPFLTPVAALSAPAAAVANARYLEDGTTARLLEDGTTRTTE